MDIPALERIGRKLIDSMAHRYPALPLIPWRDFDLRFAFEYPAHRYEAELGFWAKAMGLRFLSIDKDYAICTNDSHAYTFALRRAELPFDLSPMRIQWFTDGLDGVLESLNKRGTDHHLIRHSAVQRYAKLLSPSGMPVEIWSGNEGEQP